MYIYIYIYTYIYIYILQSYSESGTAVWSCNTELSRGFEFGGHDYVWSMHVGIRQAMSVREVSVTSIAVDKRTADMYLVGRILGACDEGPQVFTTQFTCFTSTKVHILTPEGLCARAVSA